jgi:hypothetical protein
MNADKHDPNCAIWFERERCDCAQKAEEDSDQEIESFDAHELVDRIRARWNIGLRLRRSYHDET